MYHQCPKGLSFATHRARDRVRYRLRDISHRGSEFHPDVLSDPPPLSEAGDLEVDHHGIFLVPAVAVPIRFDDTEVSSVVVDALDVSGPVDVEVSVPIRRDVQNGNGLSVRRVGGLSAGRVVSGGTGRQCVGHGFFLLSGFEDSRQPTKGELICSRAAVERARRRADADAAEALTERCVFADARHAHGATFGLRRSRAGILDRHTDRTTGSHEKKGERGDEDLAHGVSPVD